jgi:polyketide synthase PksN
MKVKQYATNGDLVRQADAVDIAIVGMACRFPGAGHYDEYWQNIISGENCIREVPADRWNWRDYSGDPRVEVNKTYARWGGFIDAIDKFDPLFFGIAPNEAAFMDPQHRLFLEAAWHAVEDAGYSVASLAGKAVGVYAGVSKNDYAELMRESRHAVAPYVSTGTVHSILANRVSFLFDLRGRSEVVDTASSSSLVALHNAIRDIASGECEAAIVGGVNALITPTMFISHSRSGVLSPNGQCRTFSADANGYVRSEGVGVLFIKPLHQALRDRDHVHAVIKTSAVSHGGRSNFLTSPSAEGQATVVMRALRKGNIDPRSVSYIEAHGTGTPLGDPIEVNGLKKAFALVTQEFPHAAEPRQPYCALSSVKTNVGHLESAAGMAGLIKVVMAMKHGQIPAIRNFTRLNPDIELDGSPFFIATENVAWESEGRTRRAGVSSFGLGGVNAHVVLEEAPATTLEPAGDSKEHLFVLSARKGRLRPYAESLVGYLERQKEQLRLQDVAFTLQIGRDAFDERLAVAASSMDELIAGLEQYVRSGTTAPGGTGNDLAARWMAGARIDWSGIYTGSSPRRVALPTYPFARKRCWFTDLPSTEAPAAHADEMTAYLAGIGKDRMAEGLSIRAFQEAAAVAESSVSPVVEASSAPRSDALLTAVQDLIRSKLAESVGLPVNEIDVSVQFDRYGVTSVMVKELNQVLEELLGPIPKTLFFEYRNVSEVAQYFIENHGDSVARLTGEREASRAVPSTAPVSDQQHPVDVAVGLAPRLQPVEAAHHSGDIAIVSAAGRLPGAPNLDALWDVLREGRDCVTEIPPDRFDYRKYFDADPARERIYSKWGGFIDDVDRFDPGFFNISPREAELIDPQERIFLEVVWEMLENAGYTRQRLHALSDRRVGVFVGAWWQAYESVGIEATIAGNVVGPSSQLYSIANRVSYFLDLAGPSLALDTACSSSLTALHFACQSIRSGESRLAIVGGVNLSLTASKYLFLAQNRFLSTDGRCRSYGAGGDGYVPGEGVCAVLLKPLANAIADRDSILAVIKGSAVNHGGRTNGYTVPNPKAQGNVIAEALEHARIDPQAVTYIEGHGTGTALGDPVEIAGLEKALGLSRGGTRVCPIGSLKSNIGHLEAAAGIASVIKVILQMQNGQLAPSIHAEQLNPNVDFETSSFRVQHELAPWARPRCAGVSSFGAGGANAHVILEEYVEEQAGAEGPASFVPAMVVLSAKDAERLKAKAVQLREWIRSRKLGDRDLAGVACTLQTGREAMEHRVAMMVGSMQELDAKLGDFIDGTSGIEGLYRGEVKRNDEVLTFFRGDEELRDAVGKWIRRGKWSKLLELWVRGLEIDWEQLYGEKKPRMVSLPTYPFARVRCWIDMPAGRNTAAHGAALAVLHPLLHRNTSDLNGLRYSSTFNGGEFFLTDHQIGNGDGAQKVLPGVAYLEMARAAIRQASPNHESDVLELRDTVWLHPIVVVEPEVVSITLSADGDRIDYEIYTEEAGQDTVHCQGRAVFSRRTASDRIDLGSLAPQMEHGRVEAAEFYALCARMGCHYGPAHRGVTAIHLGEKQLLAELLLPAVVEAHHHEYLLHPSVMDAALQATLALLVDRNDVPATPFVPFSAESLRILSPPAKEMAAWVRSSGALKVDIDLCDLQGKVCVEIRGFVMRPLDGKAARASTVSEGLSISSSFDETLYETLIADVVSRAVTVDEAAARE